MKESPHPAQAQNVPTATKFERLKQTGSAHKSLSHYRQARSEPEPNTSPFDFMHFLAQHVHGYVAGQCSYTTAVLELLLRQAGHFAVDLLT